jgi:hypothetical protein
MAEHTWLWRVEETMGLLDGLDFTGSGNGAQAALIAAGVGRERGVVLWAQKFRRAGGVPRWALESDVTELEGRLAEAEAHLARLKALR